jgi:16S rRNA (cytidine1402-2'-O)-methyltransferase
VEAIPGASAALTALVISGLPTDRFLFAGFLPTTSGARRSALEELKPVKASLILFEAPRRLGECLRDMREILGPRQAIVAREMTKLHEEVRRGELDVLAESYAVGASPLGEATIVVGPPPPDQPDLGRADILLDKALAFMPVRAAADFVSDALNIPRRSVYARALARKESLSDG